MFRELAKHLLPGSIDGKGAAAGGVDRKGTAP
jgi:hypothetical protein